MLSITWSARIKNGVCVFRYNVQEPYYQTKVKGGQKSNPVSPVPSTLWNSLSHSVHLKSLSLFTMTLLFSSETGSFIAQSSLKLSM